MNCQTLEVVIRMDAPNTARPISGVLLYDVETTTPEGTFSGIAGVELRGRAIELE